VFYALYLSFYIGCAGSVGILLAGWVIYFLRVCLCGVAGRYNFIWALWWCGWRDCTVFFLSHWLCSGGYGTVEMVKGWSVFSCFLQFAVTSLGGWMSAVRVFVLYIPIFFGRFAVLSCGFFFRKLLIFNNLLQVVLSQSELGGGPGTSA
jgi:hypothetical protein